MEEVQSVLGGLPFDLALSNTMAAKRILAEQGVGDRTGSEA